jgi:hypothetical protein
MFRRGRKNETDEKASTSLNKVEGNGGQKLWYKRPVANSKTDGRRTGKDALVSNDSGGMLGYEDNIDPEHKEAESDPWDAALLNNASKGPKRHGPVDDCDSITDRSFISGTFNVSLQSEMDVSSRYRVQPSSSSSSRPTGGTIPTAEVRATVLSSNRRSSMPSQPSQPQRTMSTTPVRHSQRLDTQHRTSPQKETPPLYAISDGPKVGGSDLKVPPSPRQTWTSPILLLSTGSSKRDLYQSFSNESSSRDGLLPSTDHINPTRTGTAVNNRNSVLHYRRMAQQSQHPNEEEKLGSQELHGHLQDTVGLVEQQSTTISAPGKPGDEVINVVDDYYARYAQKVGSYGGNGPASTGSRSNPYVTEEHYVGMESPVVSSGEQLYHHHQHGQQETETTSPTNGPDPAQVLADTMQSDIQKLEHTIEQLRRDLRRKGDDIDSIHVDSSEVTGRAEDLQRLLQEEQASARSRCEEYERRRGRLAILHARMAELQAEIAWEESNLEPLERSVLSSQQEAMVVENRLYDCRGELDRMEAMKHALQEERDAIARNLDHTESELLSLKAIQEMALGGDLG